MIGRQYRSGTYSIERVFAEVGERLSAEFVIENVTCATPADGGLWLPSGLYRAYRGRAVLNHVSGDIHYVAIALPRKRTIVTVHDLARLNQLRGLRRLLFRWLYFTLPLRKAARVTAISTHTSEQLAYLFPWVRKKLSVIPDCIPSSYQPVPRPFRSAQPRILQIGTGPNKNLERVVRALAGEPCMLHIIGRLGMEQRLLLEQSGIRYENEIDISDKQIHRAYVECDVVTFVSLAEGFGLPVVEAHAIGRPVITSNRAPMCEIAGDAACLVDPDDVTNIRNGLRRVVQDDMYREELIRKGYENAARFRVDSVSSQYAGLYRELLAVAYGEKRVG